MNQHIRELAKQAGGEFWQRLENGAVNPEAYVSFDPPESLEKFVRLIVRECAELVKDFYQEDEFTCYSAKTEIKEHFGVEE